MSEEFSKEERVPAGGFCRAAFRAPAGQSHCRAGCRKARRGTARIRRRRFRMIPGRGVCAAGGGQGRSGRATRSCCGSRACRWTVPRCRRTDSVPAGLHGDLCGGGRRSSPAYLALSDTLRQESAATIEALSQLGVQPVLLTGDHENAAAAIAAKLKHSSRCRPTACRRIS